MEEPLGVVGSNEGHNQTSALLRGDVGKCGMPFDLADYSTVSPLKKTTTLHVYLGT